MNSMLGSRTLLTSSLCAALVALAPFGVAAQTAPAKPAAKPAAKPRLAKTPPTTTPATQAPAAETPKLLGTWDVVAVTPQGELPVSLTIKLVDGQPKCDIDVAGAKQAVSDEKLEAGTLSMKVTYEFGVYDVTAKTNGEALEGTWQGAGYSGALKGTRHP